MSGHLHPLPEKTTAAPCPHLVDGRGRFCFIPSMCEMEPPLTLGSFTPQTPHPGRSGDEIYNMFGELFYITTE